MNDTTVITQRNPFGDAPEKSNALANTDQSRAVAEVQASLMIARMNPRSQQEAMDRILTACQRPTLADAAVYSYAKGGSEISGPSIRLAEAIAREWGNLNFGIRELESTGGKSTVQAYCWDTQTNVRAEKVFQVEHVRHTKRGSYRIEDAREIYEMVANNGARRLRACILAIIPGDVVDSAVRECEATMKASADTSPAAIAKMVDAFAPIGVTKAMIEKRIQRRIDTIQPAQLVSLRKIFRSLSDGMASPADFFEVEDAAPVAGGSTARLEARAPKRQQEPASAPPDGPLTDAEKAEAMASEAREAELFGGKS